MTCARIIIIVFSRNLLSFYLYLQRLLLTMATPTDYRGKMLVWGYIRSIETKYEHMNIPLEINDIICLYHRIREEWDEKYSSSFIKIDATKSIITITTDESPTVYGTLVVSEGIFVWKVKMISWEPTQWGSPPFVGITEDIHEHLEEYKDASGWTKKGYEMCGKSGALFYPSKGEHYHTKNYKGRWDKEGDILEITLNLDERTLSFKTNDTDFGVAFGNIKVARYRLVITFWDNKDSKFQLLE